MSEKAITVVGSINVDFSVRAPRLPVVGESVVGDEFLQAFGGKGANQAVGIAKLTDLPVQFVGAVGEDKLGQQGIESLDQYGISTNFVRRVHGVKTGVALIMIDAVGENCIVAAPGANAFIDEDYVRSLPDCVFTDSQLLVVCQEIPVESIEILVSRAKEFQLPVQFNPAPPNPRLLNTRILEHVEYLTPNETETAFITGIEVAELTSGSGCQNALARLRDLGCSSVAITLGKSGCFAFDSKIQEADLEGKLIKAPVVSAVDTTAAGDSFNAGLAVALAEGKSFYLACEWANQIAALSVTRRGAQPSLPSRGEVESST